MPTFKDNPELIREVIMDHYEYPRNKKLKNDPEYTRVNLDSESCIDNIDLEVKIEDGIIKDICFDAGFGCLLCPSLLYGITKLLF